jgi:hypothetical protein
MICNGESLTFPTIWSGRSDASRFTETLNSEAHQRITTSCLWFQWMIEEERLLLTGRDGVHFQDLIWNLLTRT